MQWCGGRFSGSGGGSDDGAVRWWPKSVDVAAVTDEWGSAAAGRTKGRWIRRRGWCSGAVGGRIWQRRRWAGGAAKEGVGGEFHMATLYLQHETKIRRLP